MRHAAKTSGEGQQPLAGLIEDMRLLAEQILDEKPIDREVG